MSPLHWKGSHIQGCQADDYDATGSTSTYFQAHPLASFIHGPCVMVVVVVLISAACCKKQQQELQIGRQIATHFGQPMNWPDHHYQITSFNLQHTWEGAKVQKLPNFCQQLSHVVRKCAVMHRSSPPLDPLKHGQIAFLPTCWPHFQTQPCTTCTNVIESQAL